MEKEWFDSKGNALTNQDHDAYLREQSESKRKDKAKRLLWCRVVPIRAVAADNILIRNIAEDMKSLEEEYEVRNVFAIDRWQLLFDPAKFNIKKVDIEQAKKVLTPQQLYDYAGDISRMR